jgi:hypothetical protein
MMRNHKKYLIDLSIRRYRHIVDSTSFYGAVINDLGDLSINSVYQKLNGDKMKAYPGKIYPDTLKNKQKVKKLDFKKLLRRGYTGVVVKKAPDESFLQNIPVNIIAKKHYSNKISTGSTPNLYLKKGDKIRYVIVNGYVYDTKSGQVSSIKNTLVIK